MAAYGISLAAFSFLLLLPTAYNQYFCTKYHSRLYRRAQTTPNWSQERAGHNQPLGYARFPTSQAKYVTVTKCPTSLDMIIMMLLTLPTPSMSLLVASCQGSPLMPLSPLSPSTKPYLAVREAKLCFDGLRDSCGPSAKLPAIPYLHAACQSSFIADVDTRFRGSPPTLRFCPAPLGNYHQPCAR